MNDKEKEYPKPPPGIKPLKNGAGYDVERKRIAVPPGTYGPAPKQITPELSAKYKEVRKERTAQAIRDAIIEQAGKHNVNVKDSSDAIGYAAGVLFSEVLKSKGQLRDKNTTLWSIGKHAGLVEDGKNAPTSQTNVQVNIDSRTLRDILSTTGGQTIDIDE